MWVVAKFILWADTRDVEEFTRASGLAPDHSISPRVVQLGDVAQAREGRWEIWSRLAESDTAHDHIDYLFLRLRENKESLLRARELADACVVLCALHYEDEYWGVPGVSLDTEQVALLAEFRASFDVDISIRETKPSDVHRSNP